MVTHSPILTSPCPFKRRTATGKSFPLERSLSCLMTVLGLKSLRALTSQSMPTVPVMSVPGRPAPVDSANGNPCSAR